MVCHTPPLKKAKKTILVGNDFSSEVVKLVTTFLRCAIRYVQSQMLLVATVKLALCVL